MEPQEQQQHHPETLPPSSTMPPPTCCKCGGPTALAAPPPNYRPIRAPAINTPPNNNSQQAIILAPVPQPKPVPPISPPFHFQPPSKQIQSPDDIRRFHDSPSGQHFLGFVVALSQSIRSKKISDPCHVSPVTSTLVSILDTLLCWVGEIPPTQQAARYGNVSYRVWHDRVVQNAPHLMLKFLPPHLEPSTVEIVPYFTDAFGNPSRIDYGTGHETNFAAWLYCLARMEVIKEEDYPAVVARVFVKYLELMRKLQLVYCLEPAGSHGVWGLDDYHFLPFIFGSSQLIDHKYMKPKSIHNDDILENFSEEYMYLSGVAFVKKVKKGPFSEHSPLLDDVSGVPNWNKVNSGMLKMYKVEVLEKVPIMQHFLFGWLIKWHYSSLEVALEYFRCGADKISIGSDAVYAAEEYLRTGVKSGKSSLEQISRVYGNQAVVVSIDPRRVYVKNQNDVKFKTIRVTNPGPNGEEYAWYQCTVSGGWEGRPIGAYELAKAVEELGAGEILLNCIDCDGQGKGFDIDLLKLISDAVTIPVIASSGAGSV